MQEIDGGFPRDVGFLLFRRVYFSFGTREIPGRWNTCSESGSCIHEGSRFPVCFLLAFFGVSRWFS